MSENKGKVNNIQHSVSVLKQAKLGKYIIYRKTSIAHNLRTRN